MATGCARVWYDCTVPQLSRAGIVAGRRRPIIIRIFRARLKPGMRSAFEQLCHERSIPLIRSNPGSLAVHVGKPAAGRSDDFVLVSVWRDLPSLKAFAGERWDEALILPGEADLLEEAAVEHYDESYHSLINMWHALADVVRRREEMVTTAPLTDAQWERVRPLLPSARREGRPRADDRRTLDGILYVLRTGCRWQDLPAAYGSPVTCWRRLTRWEADGTWERIWHALLTTLDAHGKLAWAQAFVDSRHIPTRRRRQRSA
jgi:transposase/quinol monooxygenase YgiN